MSKKNLKKKDEEGSKESCADMHHGRGNLLK
jgi:hypothetical protein